MRGIPDMIQAQPSVAFYSFPLSGFPLHSNPETQVASVSISRFQGQSGVEEYHLIVRPTDYASIETQLEWVYQAYQLALKHVELDPGTSVLRRFFCSDLANQASVLQSSPVSGFPLHSNPETRVGFSDPIDGPCAISWVGQPPAPPAKVALWAYHISDPTCALEKSIEGSSLKLERDNLAHIWTTGITSRSGDRSYSQTEGILEKYEACLRTGGLSLDKNLIRTWFFVRDVDANYKGLVDARREVFARHGLTADTHYIASTGIEGTSADIAAIVTMDAYSISGVRADQIEFLSAPDHLSPTNLYGVTFERGVSVAYQDRKHVTISGTASIDSAGKIVHPGDVLRQLDRTLENVEALLKEAGATLQDVCVFVVYVRDPNDVGVAQKAMSERVGEAPFQIVIAPVCRPGWLIEIECQAIIPTSCPSLPAF